MCGGREGGGSGALFSMARSEKAFLRGQRSSKFRVSVSSPQQIRSSAFDEDRNVI